MSRTLPARIHACAATGALAIIAAFLTSSAVIEPIGDPGEVRGLRLAILTVLPVLVACLATAALTGRRLAGRSRSAVVRRKQRRMQVVAAAGLLVLIPCAVALNALAASTAAGGLTAALEITEFLAGALNLAMLALNFRDGRRMTRRRRAARAARSAQPVQRPSVVGAAVVHTGP